MPITYQDVLNWINEHKSELGGAAAGATLGGLLGKRLAGTGGAAAGILAGGAGGYYGGGALRDLIMGYLSRNRQEKREKDWDELAPASRGLMTQMGATAPTKNNPFGTTNEEDNVRALIRRHLNLTTPEQQAAHSATGQGSANAMGAEDDGSQKPATPAKPATDAGDTQAKPDTKKPDGEPTPMAGATTTASDEETSNIDRTLGQLAAARRKSAENKLNAGAGNLARIQARSASAGEGSNAMQTRMALAFAKQQQDERDARARVSSAQSRRRAQDRADDARIAADRKRNAGYLVDNNAWGQGVATANSRDAARRLAYRATAASPDAYEGSPSSAFDNLTDKSPVATQVQSLLDYYKSLAAGMANVR